MHELSVCAVHNKQLMITIRMDIQFVDRVHTTFAHRMVVCDELNILKNINNP